MELKGHKEELEKVLQDLEQKDKEIAAWLSERENADESKEDPDSLIKAGDPLSDQLFDQVATIAAIDDTLFHLDQCLSNSLIELQPYLKQVRALAGQQFLAKALATKIVAKQRMTSAPPAYGAAASPHRGK